MIASILENFNLYLNQFQEFAKINPVFGGLIGMWIIGVVSLGAKFLPRFVKNMFMRHLTVTMVVNNGDQFYYHLNKWLEKTGFGKKTRNLRVGNGLWGVDKTSISMGYGHEWLIFDGTLVFIRKNKEEKDGGMFGTQVKETVTITSLGRSQKTLRKLVEKIENEINDITKVSVYKWKDNWQLAHKQPKREFSSIFISEDNTKKLFNTIENFEKDKEFYEKNGIPRNLGILLHGPPGTGKTSLIKGLATHTKRDLCKINIKDMSDASLEDALAKSGDKSIVLIEDIDATDLGVRDLEAETKIVSSDGKALTKKGKLLGVTLSGLLNAIDGVTSGEGRILIMTTNSRSSLDPALLRKGRVDLDLEIGYLDSETFARMMKSLYPDFYFPSKMTVKYGVTGAEVQGAALENRNSPKQLLDKFTEKESSDHSANARHRN